MYFTLYKQILFRPCTTEKYRGSTLPGPPAVTKRCVAIFPSKSNNSKRRGKELKSIWPSETVSWFLDVCLRPGALTKGERSVSSRFCSEDRWEGLQRLVDFQFTHNFHSFVNLFVANLLEYADLAECSLFLIDFLLFAIFIQRS